MRVFLLMMTEATFYGECVEQIELSETLLSQLNDENNVGESINKMSEEKLREWTINLVEISKNCIGMLKKS